ncbi:MAG: hypothetical protein ACQR33_01430 [Candidatus Saccharibacteria bacterium]
MRLASGRNCMPSSDTTTTTLFDDDGKTVEVIDPDMLYAMPMSGNPYLAKQFPHAGFYWTVFVDNGFRPFGAVWMTHITKVLTDRKILGIKVGTYIKTCASHAMYGCPTPQEIIDMFNQPCLSDGVEVPSMPASVQKFVLTHVPAQPPVA